MSGIRVTPEQLSALSSRVAAGSASIESELGGLSAGLAPLGSDWAGTAQARFVELWSQWQRSAETLHASLDGISRLLSQAGRAYADAEQAIAASFAVR